MFKYVKFKRVADDVTTYEFRGGSSDVKINHFNIDVVSIESEIESDIDDLVASQDESINCEFITREEFEDLVKTTIQYLRILEVVEEKFSQILVPISKEYPLEERESWNLQIEEAKAFMASKSEADAPYLFALASSEDGDILDFAQSVIAKNTSYKNFHVAALAEKRRLKRELLSAIGI